MRMFSKLIMDQAYRTPSLLYRCIQGQSMRNYNRLVIKHCEGVAQCQGTDIKPLELTGHHMQSAAPPQASCLTLRAALNWLATLSPDLS